MAIIDTLIVFRVLKLLTTKWENQAAYKHGLIDSNGKRTNKKPETSAEKDSMSLLHRMVFNLKRLINKVPFGKTAFASYAVALALLKESLGNDISGPQMDDLCEKFYNHIKEEGVLTTEMIIECQQVQKLILGNTYVVRRSILQNWEETTLQQKIYPAKQDIKILQEHSQIFGITVYVGYIGNDRILVTADDVY